MEETTRHPEALFGHVLDGLVVDVGGLRQEKWTGVFMPALRTFHSLFGHTNVPDEFTVPFSSPVWPQATWGLQLGQIITRSQDIKRLYSVQVATSQLELQKLGFTWTATSVTDWIWEQQVVPALQIFHQEHGHCNVTSNFVVPEWGSWPKNVWGLNLGAIVKSIRAGRSYDEQSTRDSEMLDMLGFLWDPSDVEWHGRILPALATLADESLGHKPMTSEFLVPSRSPWPKQTWGLELGAFLTDSHKREQYFVQIVRDSDILDGLGFDVCLSDMTWTRQVVPLLTIFSTIFPNKLHLPQNFVIPHTQPWPRKMWGLKLGKIGAQNPIRMAIVESEWKQRREAPETMWSNVAENPSRQWKIRIFPALVAFVKVFGDCRLGSHFTVPSENSWPQQTWGLRLGAEIADYLKNGTNFEQIGRDADRLDILGFSFKLSETPWRQYGAPLLKIFSRIYPCTVVSDNFVIPSEAPWHKTMWGLKLGKIIRWNTQLMTVIENEWRVQVLTAIEVYQKEHGGSSIRDKFVIPSHSPWPQKTWAMDLTRILHRLQSGEFYDGHIALARNSTATLKHFHHRSRDEAWESIFTALKTCSKRFGNCNVKPRFVVPEEPSWPKSVWGLQLGQLVYRMKTTGIYFADVGRCANRLNNLGFSLTLSVVAWEEKVAPLIATFGNLYPQDTILSGVGYGFTIPAMESWPENVWGVNLGVLVQWNLNRLETIEHDWRDLVLLANDVYHYENGNKILRDQFVVPCRPPWPYKTWGTQLRRILTCVQVGQHYGGHIALVNSNDACAVASDTNERWKMTIFPALRTFAMVFGHCSVPEDYVVPSKTPWPKQTFELHLGSITTAIEKRGLYFAEVGLNADRLEAFGFRYKLADAPWQEHVAPLLQMYATQYPHEILPEDFVIPPKQPWPEELYGLRLGKIMSWSSRFTWKSKEAQWRMREMPENTKFAGEFGYCQVPARFKVPSEFPWPTQMWGLRMKVYLRQLNRNGDLFLSGGLHRALMSEKNFGFVFKLVTVDEISFGKPECDVYKAEVEQIEGESFEPEICLGKRSLPEANCSRKKGWIGSYSPSSRKERVQRFLTKRQQRVWAKEVKYDIRKSFADTRLRVKGRFVTREDEKTMRELLSLT